MSVEITSDILKVRLEMQEYDAGRADFNRATEAARTIRLEADITRLALECLTRRAADEGAVVVAREILVRGIARHWEFSTPMVVLTLEADLLEVGLRDRLTIIRRRSVEPAGGEG